MAPAGEHTRYRNGEGRGQQYRTSTSSLSACHPPSLQPSGESLRCDCELDVGYEKGLSQEPARQNRGAPSRVLIHRMVGRRCITAAISTGDLPRQDLVAARLVPNNVSGAISAEMRDPKTMANPWQPTPHHQVPALHRTAWESVRLGDDQECGSWSWRSRREMGSDGGASMQPTRRFLPQ